MRGVECSWRLKMTENRVSTKFGALIRESGKQNMNPSNKQIDHFEQTHLCARKTTDIYVVQMARFAVSDIFLCPTSGFLYNIYLYSRAFNRYCVTIAHAGESDRVKVSLSVPRGAYTQLESVASRLPFCFSYIDAIDFLEALRRLEHLR